MRCLVLRGDQHHEPAGDCKEEHVVRGNGVVQLVDLHLQRLRAVGLEDRSLSKDGDKLKA